MVLVDTSVWIGHLREGNAWLDLLLEDGDAVCHPFIIGELACGHLANRTQILTLLGSLPTSEIAGQDEVLGLIESHKLMGIGLGFIDVHLLASAILTGVHLWTLELPLKKAAAALGVLFS